MSRVDCRWLACCFAAFLCVQATGQTTVEIPSRSAVPVVVETVDGELVGGLTGLNETNGITLLDQAERLSFDQALSIRFTENQASDAAIAPAGAVTLIDGSRLRYASRGFVAGSVDLVLVEGSTARVPIASIVAWDLGSSSPAPQGDEQATADVLLVKRRDGSGLAPVEGVVLEVADRGVRFAFGDNSDDDPIEVPWKRLGGIRFFRNNEAIVPRARLSLRDGSRLAADRIGLEGEGLAWRSGAGSGWLSVGSIDAIDLSAGRVTPIAELRLLDQSWKPYFEAPTIEMGHTFNQAFDGQELSLWKTDPRVPAGWPAIATVQRFDGGVAMKSRGELRFALPSEAIRLKGLVGLDPRTRRAGSADVSILAGERTIWSGTIDGSTRPIALNAPLEGEPTLTLRVDYGENLDSGDHVHFALLRVIQ